MLNQNMTPCNSMKTPLFPSLPHQLLLLLSHPYFSITSEEASPRVPVGKYTIHLDVKAQ